MKEGRRAVLYGRVSTEEQGKNGTSLRSQFSGNTAKAKDIGASVIATFEDEDSGGFYLTRRGLQDALQMLESKKANIFIVKDLVRLTRNDRAEQSLILKRIKESGAQLVFWDSVHEDSALGEFSLNIQGDFAILEKRVIKERTMAGRKRRAEEGVMPARTIAPFGYRIPKKADVIKGTYPVEQLGKYLIDEERAPVAIEIFERIDAGESLQGICRWLQQSGVKTVLGGKCWRISNIQSIVNNHSYYGLAAFGRQRTITDETRVLRGFKTRTYEVNVPEEEWIRIPCPALISKELWDRCQVRIKENHAKFSSRITRRQLLTGMLRCPKCRRVMSGRGHARSMPSHYLCKDSQAAGNSLGVACWKKCINIKRVDPLVLEAVKMVAQNPVAIENAYHEYHANLLDAFSEQEHQSLKRELSDLNRQEVNTAKAQIQGIGAGADTTVYESILRELQLKRTALQGQIDNIERARQASNGVEDRVAILLEAAQSVVGVLDASEDVIPTPKKNAVLHKIIDHIYPNLDATDFTVTFSRLGESSRLIAVVRDGEAPQITVMGLE